ncbi:hemoglobin subunit alpha-1-like [Narcine bancroftii]|uniref:hemoglobin subunit alpha-1-like n=1 Tax=Narcine bancroftii TaxID=1343680 RepID=UPI00383203A3
MVLSDLNKKVIGNLGKKIKPQVKLLGADALERLFTCHPQAKSYFTNFSGFTAKDKQVQDHGVLVLDALVEATNHLDNLPHHLEDLAKKHGTNLLVDPHNFALFSDCIAVTLAAHLSEFCPTTHCAFDKFLEEVIHQLNSQYR